MGRLIDRIIEALSRGHRFVTRDIWDIGAPGEAPPSGVIIKQLRACILLLRGVTEETVMLRASALTFATILFLVPFLAFMFFLIQTFNLGDYAYNTLDRYFENRFQAAVELLRERDEEQAAQPDSEPGLRVAPANAAEDPELAELSARLRSGINSEQDVRSIANSILAQLTDLERQALRNGRFRGELEGMIGKAVDERVTVDELSANAAGLVLKEMRNTQLAQKMMALMFPIFEDQQLFYGGSVNPVQTLLEQAQTAAQQPGAIGIAGILFILSTVFGFMRNVEYTFNRIWGVQQTRNLVRSISDYMMITLLLPFGAAMMLGVNAALENQYLAGKLGPAALTLRGGPFLILCVTFTLLYYFVPNTKVQFRYAAVSGTVAAGVWSLLSWALLRFWFQLARYQFFYSSLALVPLFLMWIYFSWLILLFGALLTFSYQNEATFSLERFADKASPAYREALAVRVAIEAARRFEKGLGGLAVEVAARDWNVPSRLLHETLGAMTQAGLLAACATEPVTYQPARSPAAVRIRDVVRVVRESGYEPSKLREDAEYAAMYRGLEQGGADWLDGTVADAVARMHTDAPEGPANA